jgi:hypothetical protein
MRGLDCEYCLPKTKNVISVLKSLMWFSSKAAGYVFEG